MRRRPDVRVAPGADSAKARGVGPGEREGIRVDRVSARERLSRGRRRQARREKSTKLSLARQGHSRWHAPWSNHSWNGRAMRRWAEVGIAHHPNRANAWGVRRKRWGGRRAALQPGRRQAAGVQPRQSAAWNLPEHLVGEACQISLVRQGGGKPAPEPLLGRVAALDAVGRKPRRKGISCRHGSDPL